MAQAHGQAADSCLRRPSASYEIHSISSGIAWYRCGARVGGDFKFGLEGRPYGPLVSRRGRIQ